MNETPVVQELLVWDNEDDYKNEMPHEFLLRVMRGRHPFREQIVQKNGQTLFKWRYPDLKERIHAAKIAAPYCYLPQFNNAIQSQLSLAESTVFTDEMQERAAKEVLIENGYTFE